MKKLSVLAAATIVLLMNTSAQAGDPVTLNITGNVIASPCQVSSDSITKSVDLGQNIQASSLQTAGAATDWVNFDINLNSCPAGTTKAIMTMHGTADLNNPADMYRNTGTATNLAVQVQSQAGEQLGNTKTISGTIASNAYTYKLRARAYTQNGGVMPGSISSVVTATFEYQ
ncbi:MULTISPECIES: fimbrial protein [Enterobacter]|uniref:fimbrial protein n=1 Tax=Enterobacter TaxID=547 RepID=UPI0005EE4786|nr:MULTISPECIES: fimbrial protein [Enterobacter]EHF4997086.1 type 1 fimbrial protein [Enterobacter hormaechei]EKV3688057.1 type 1 fimbrial protein [Enterobacter hormaechei]EKV4581910.1 type 1 fimbrial protein [Enterobacter hormaechei]EKV5349490.1 type 1 fimbrial protein [Enterobacter hormaechei]ELC6315446.1 type 1 fimbrial protein [Enterobacter hormaechei]